MLKRLIRKYLGIVDRPPIYKQELAMAVLDQLEESTWFLAKVDRAVTEGVQETLVSHEMRCEVAARKAALVAVDFINQEEFIDKIVARIRYKQL